MTTKWQFVQFEKFTRSTAWAAVHGELIKIRRLWVVKTPPIEQSITYGCASGFSACPFSSGAPAV